jgi:hypothetical protein
MRRALKQRGTDASHNGSILITFKHVRWSEESPYTRTAPRLRAALHQHGADRSGCAFLFRDRARETGSLGEAVIPFFLIARIFKHVEESAVLFLVGTTEFLPGAESGDIQSRLRAGFSALILVQAIGC